ncbi:3-hydroxyacyl-[acyl-carrier-protein] dehydratase FabZ [Priestia megaterium]|uniref:3-hydroxyacyl-ACP dehydratase FabZ n=1 Tax=Priestia TaxID=2800373 RepID=UPI000BEBF213|nr:3-hydroxyacyl-ACP dehydratase FabZ [Priestia megaterium]MED3976715.1 3-hydroxyacyl-ACP dehydratase FabZ [Priestia megaterium]PEB64274.1 3-hydroxyacyl-[acyl-carrier-protein] dehydratase FabZ [Priestia megaterium]PFI85446.1 3-hydroxyacyl-[acyl-carrier-protein] dehydratase FabZ [Priestia megaterium]PGR15044.1 3-hydroxyacyl-[acyl-carrier-protein] dehydratase FabZ [Priestia megaterium]
MLDIQEIQRIIPHRYPFLLVDKIIKLKEGKNAIELKNVTANEEFFSGHFPGYSVMPGVLIVEALAQVSGMIMLQKEDNREKIGLLTGIENCRFKKQVRPGDQLYLEVEMTRVRGAVAKAHGIAKVDNNIVCEADLTFFLWDNGK